MVLPSSTKSIELPSFQAFNLQMVSSDVLCGFCNSKIGRVIAALNSREDTDAKAE